MESLLCSSEQLKKYCEGLTDKERKDLYEQVLNKAKEVIDNTKDIDQIRKLSRAAVVIEETTDKELLNLFEEDHPFREVNIVTYTAEGKPNYLFSMGDSSELYDVKEDREKALYQGIKSNDVEIIKHLLMILVPEEMFLNNPTELEISTYFGNRIETYKLRDRGNDEIKKINLKYLKELEILLRECYEKLKSSMTKDMKSYLEKKLKFYNFLCDARVDEKNVSELIKLFADQKEVDYQIDLLLLSLIAEYTEKEEVLERIKKMVDLIEKYRDYEELEYKVRRLKQEVESGKADKKTLGKKENKMREIGEEIRGIDSVGERNKLVKQLQIV